MSTSRAQNQPLFKMYIIEARQRYCSNGLILLPDPSVEEKIRIAILHMDRLIDLRGEHVAIREMRKHMAWYLKGLQGAARVKDEVDVPLSIDTYKSEVARKALEAGAHLINDIWGLAHDPAMAEVVASYHCPVVIMHNRQQMNYEKFLE